MNNIPQDTPQKQCSRCKGYFAATSEFFGRDKQKKDGFYPMCKICRQPIRKADNDSHVEYRKRRYQERIEQEHAYRKQRGQVHRDQSKRSYHRYKEAISARRKQFRKSHPEVQAVIDRVHKHKRKAQKKASGGSYTAQQLQEQLTRQKRKCYYCKVKLGTLWHADHVIPLSRGGTNTIDNIVIACPSCNMHKHNKLPHEWPEGNRLL